MKNKTKTQIILMFLEAAILVIALYALIFRKPAFIHLMPIAVIVVLIDSIIDLKNKEIWWGLLFLIMSFFLLFSYIKYLI